MKKTANNKKNMGVYLNVPGIDPRINEIISYLSVDFSKSKILERDDLAQELYLLYLEMVKKNKKVLKQKPGYFFIKFKWYLLTRLKNKQKRLNKEWSYVREKLREAEDAANGEEEDIVAPKVPDYIVQQSEKSTNKKIKGKKTKYGFWRNT